MQAQDLRSAMAKLQDLGQYVAIKSCVQNACMRALGSNFRDLSAQADFESARAHLSPTELPPLILGRESLFQKAPARPAPTHRFGLRQVRPLKLRPVGASSEHPRIDDDNTLPTRKG